VVDLPECFLNSGFFSNKFFYCSLIRLLLPYPYRFSFKIKQNIHITMKLVLAALLAGSAAAFAPTQQAKSSTALNVNELEIGMTAPLGVYDPLGWLETQPESFERRRAVERKHGRIAMAAVVGVIVHNNHITFDGYLSTSLDLKFSDIPTGVDGIRAIPTAGLCQILAFFALVELAWMPASQYDGDYGVGWFGENLNPEEKSRKLNAEINNGRAAMMGILGNMVVECMTGQTMYEQYSAGHISPFGDGAGAF
jgi:light-harvesting complex I chlorophyll a/b binding protein 1